MINAKAIGLLVLCGVFLASIGEAQAVNYFSWGVETLRPSFGVNGTASYDVQWHGNTVRDCAVHHAGACSMRLDVIGDDGGNGSMGADLVEGPPAYPWNFVGSPSVYYRWWMRIDPGFSWGNATAKTKSSRVIGETYPRGYTGYLMDYGFLIGECEDVGEALPGGGCLLADGSNNTDSNLYIPYDFTAADDGQWHEYIVRIKPNTSATCTAPGTCDAEFQAWVDGVSVGEYNDFRLHNKAVNDYREAWGGWMVSPYFQLNGTAQDGGTIYIDDISTDDAYNSLLGVPDVIPPGAPTGLAAG